MATIDTIAARGTIALVISQGCFFVFGYFTVVFLAREIGPSNYGTYSVILAVLVWLEQSGRFAIPSATAKLLAEATHHREELEKSAFALNLGLHCVFFVLLWATAPWLEGWFGIDNGTFLFRLAAIDLPFFGAYTSLQAIHQGYRHFFRLSLSQIMYALAKLIGIFIIAYHAISLEKALLVNIASSIVGLLFVLSGSSLQTRGRWLARISPIAVIAAPLGLYSIAYYLIGSLNIWTLQIMSPASEVAMIGVFVAALNIARAPAFALGRPKQPIGLAHFLDLRVRAQNPAILGIPM